MRTDELDYVLPPELIAQTPAERRDAARLMVVHAEGNRVEHRHVRDLPKLLRAGDLLVFNDTRVLPARFYATRDKSGGKVEGLYLGSRNEQTWEVMLKSGGHLGEGETVSLNGGHRLELLDKRPDGTWIVQKRSPKNTLELLESVGVMPLPPYIERKSDQLEKFAAMDRQRYQTVYADRPGAVAAPTAGLHFTPELLGELQKAAIETAHLTLHVGTGTFAPVRTDTLEEHEMHSEWFTVPSATLAAITVARAQGRRIIPVGTTSVRALESLPPAFPTDRDYAGETRLLIQPGFKFRFTDGLMTNFHLPRSTLLALVAALTGLDRLKELYRLAIAERYRFYSYGDAMLVLPEKTTKL